MAFIMNWAEDKIATYAKTGIQAGGTLAGNAVGGVGGLVESAGQSAAKGVQGGIGGVGGYINNYGNKVKGSMAADGPVSSAQKKTAVKPSAPTAAQKSLPTTAGAKKALPSTGGAQKALPAASQRPNASTSQGARPNTGGVQKPTQNSRVSAPSNNARTAGRVPASRPSAASSGAATGKVSISSESRPKVGGAQKPFKSSMGPKSKPDPSNMLGVGNTNKGPAKSPAKPSAGDPLGMGDDLMSMGKKK
ncbi:hypothetical protein LTR37_017294 [Vermiconidia calcicola]|uniref:Uncharacterized protein n=1 Tax=Vermiconidia calcicola TaxID=1690605 RepID=A0ACC3MKM4_9PEZI|nr:hypothetical protein LTR37_017294 [Vermiconidia calcicola]